MTHSAKFTAARIGRRSECSRTSSLRVATVLGVLAAALLLSNSLVGQPTEKSTKLVASLVKSQDDYATKAFQMFAERTRQYTAGKVNVEVHYGGELGYKGGDGLRILRTRAVDISETIGAYEAATVPDLEITNLPFFIKSLDEFAFFDRLFRPHLDKLFEKNNAKCLASYSVTLQHFFNKKKIDTLADLSGIKMRTYDKATTDMLSALGARPLRIDFTEVYTALQQGTIEGMVTSVASVQSMKAYEVVTHANLTGFSTGGLNCIAINLAAWNALSPAQQVGMLRAARETEDWLRVRVPELEREGLADLKTRGMVVHEVPPATIAEMRRRTADMRTEFMKSKASPELKAIIEKYERIRGI